MSAERDSPRTPPAGAVPSNGSWSEHDRMFLARQWFPLARSDGVETKPRQLTLIGVRLVVYRMPEGVRIGLDRCPHRGLPLSTGRIVGDKLVCAYHGLRFGSDGRCRQAPEKLAHLVLDCNITMFPAVERHGLVWTCLDPQAGAEIPNIRLKTEGLEQGELARPFLHFPGDWASSIQFDFSKGGVATNESHDRSLKNFAIGEYKRLLDEVESSATARVASSSSDFSSITESSSD